jgi:beta-glucanase (GH16 family)
MNSNTIFSSLLLMALLSGCSKSELPSACPEQQDIFLPGAPSGYCWENVFQEDFNAPALDESKWFIWNGDREESISRPEAVRVEDGKLVIQHYYDAAQDKYISAFVGTLGRFEQAYGFYTARVRVNKHSGWNSGFWLVGQGVDGIENGGVDGSEIDIIEMPFQNNDLLHAIHWNGYGPEQQSDFKIITRPDLKAGAFHEFSVWWGKDEYIFYIDGQESWRSKGGGISEDSTTYLILSSEVNTQLAGPVSSTSLPLDYQIDWVRVYDLVPAK